MNAKKRTAVSKRRLIFLAKANENLDLNERTTGKAPTGRAELGILIVAYNKTEDRE